MAAIFPISSFFLLYLLFIRLPGLGISGWREAVLAAALAWGLLTTISVELLSLGFLLDFNWAASFWISVDIITGLSIFILHYRENNPGFGEPLPKPPAPGPALLFLERLIAVQAGFILAVVGLIAIIAPPNTWDSLTYHMPRVMHWIQNHSVANYPTSILRQIVYTPWAEYAILQLQLLADSDQLANLVQFFSMAASAVGVSLIARELGADRKTQALSALVCTAIPMGILQGSSTQNDYATAFWLVCFVYFGLRVLSANMCFHCVSAAAALGLAFLTKGTAYLMAMPFLAALILGGFARYGRGFWKQLVMIVGIVVIVNSGYYWRSFELYGNVLGPLNETIVSSKQSVRLTALASNTICNAALQFGGTSRDWNDLVQAKVSEVHARLGINASTPDNKLAGSEFHLPGHLFHEDHAGNLLHSLFFLIAALIFIFPVKRSNSFGMSYLICLIGAFLIFNAFIQWNMFNNRYLLPLFVLGVPWAVTVMANGRGKFAVVLGLIFFIGSLPWLFFNQSRPLLGAQNILNQPREQQYFANNPGYLYSYAATAKHIMAQNCRNIGLVMGVDSWEYPLWPFLTVGQYDVRIEHVLVNNITREIHSESFVPCALIGDEEEKRSAIIFGPDIYRLKRSFAFLKIFGPDKPVLPLQQSVQQRLFEVLRYEAWAEEAWRTKQIPKMLEVRRTILLRAKDLGQAELDVLYAGLGRNFVRNLRAGNTLVLEGFVEKDQVKAAAGMQLIKQWDEWFTNNYPNFKF